MGIDEKNAKRANRIPQRNCRRAYRLLVPSLLFLACATTPVPERERMQASMRWEGEVRELASSQWVSPFFRDGSRLLLTQDHPSEVELLVTPKGEPIPPGEPIEVLPAGTRVVVKSVAFPTRWQMTTRPLMTPREQPWVELAVEGREKNHVLVLSPLLDSEEKVSAEISRWLVRPGLAVEVASLPEKDQQLVKSMELSTGVSRRALELAFGPPRSRSVRGEEGRVVETWSWVSDTGVKRSAQLEDGVVVSIEAGSAKDAGDQLSGKVQQ